MPAQRSSQDGRYKVALRAVPQRPIAGNLLPTAARPSANESELRAMLLLHVGALHGKCVDPGAGRALAGGKPSATVPLTLPISFVAKEKLIAFGTKKQSWRRSPNHLQTKCRCWKCMRQNQDATSQRWDRQRSFSSIHFRLRSASVFLESSLEKPDQTISGTSPM